MARPQRRTIGTSPFDSIIPAPSEAPQPRTEARPTEIPVKVVKERLTVHLPTDLIERAKNAVYWTPGLTLAGLAEQAFLNALAEREAKNGGPFQQRPEELKGGRPIK